MTDRVQKICWSMMLMLIIHVGTAQDLRTNVSRSLFSDQKAGSVGDAVTILIVETSSASNDAKTLSGRSDDLSLGGNLNTGSGSGTDVSLNLGTKRAFKGEGATQTRGSVRGKLSAQVDSVLANGNLVITGNRSITVNGEEQTISVRGIVRPSDIHADNSVYSFNIAEAVIVVRGDGIVSEAQGPGLLTKFLHFLF
ncbi:MAG: flagellar basal body L-ring protein FlgH [Ignavibacteria bacterium]|nr:flagellar basal body L-ring protein FlgH [Ignavibacteria bacterium]